MIYTVVWTPTADDELMEIGRRASDRIDIADAADRMSQVLRRDPLDKLTHEHEGLYSFLLWPLTILCEVHPDDRLVLIVQVRRF